MKPTRNRARTWLITSALVAGTALGAAGVASAATNDPASTTSNTGPAQTQPAPSDGAPQGAPSDSHRGGPQGQDPFTMTNGPGEELLTGSIAEQVTAKALEAVPGATVIRVETDAHGAKYEAHLKKADGTAVTVTFDENLTVEDTIDGFGVPPQGDHQGPPPAGAPQGAPTTQPAA